MDAETRALVRKHVEHLLQLAIDYHGMPIGDDAVRSLACMVLVSGSHPDGGGSEADETDAPSVVHYLRAA